MPVLRSVLHLIIGSARLAVSWMGTTFLAVAVLVAPFLGRLLPAYRAGRWGGVKKALRSASLYTATVWAALFLIGMARFIYKGHIDLLAANTKLSADLQKVKDKERAGDDQQLREQLKRAHSEAQHWHDAYLRISRGETRPDRILNSEEANTLYEELRRISKDARNKDFIKLDFGVVQDREASHLAIQLFKIFKEAHWNVTWKKIPAGKQWPKEFEFKEIGR